ncbi:MAG: response regulator [Cyanobacteria bacterium P01_F01_bin.56]
MISAELPGTQATSNSVQSRILLVDDNPTNLKVLSESIRGQGWTTLVATDGETAIEQTSYAKPDLILLDVMMPGIDGFETCRRLKKSPDTASIPVIFMTALTDIVDRVKGLELGAVDYITKPFQQEEVVARVRLHLRLSYLNRTLEHRNSELELLNQTLEQRVADRTQELSCSIDELKETQLQLIQSEKMSALGQLVAGICHEINNPVSFINGNVDCITSYVEELSKLLRMYQAEIPEPSEQIINFVEDVDLEYLLEDLPKLVNSMRKGANRISDISSSMRILARGDKTHKVEAQLHETLDSAILLLQHRLKANEQRPAIQMRKHYGDLPPILCYPGQLNQVFMNILANAVDAFEESNKGISYEELEKSPNVIDVTTQHDNNSITIYLQDNGPGMPDAVKAKVFEHLFTTKAVGKGTGLGLSISHQIVVDTHGGSLSCDSNPGKGTTFTITLPLQ